MRMRRRLVGYDRYFKNGQADVLHYFGVNATEIFRPGDFASGNLIGKVAGTVLTPVGSPTYKQTLTGDADDPKGVGFADGSSDSFDAASSSVFNFTGSFAVLVNYKNTATPGTARTLFAKRDAADPYNGYEATLGGTQIAWRVDGGASESYSTFNYDADTSQEHWILFWQNITTGQTGITNGFRETVTASAYNPSNTATFAIGQQRTSTGPFVLGPFVIWTDANAETVINNRVSLLRAWDGADKWFRNLNDDCYYWFANKATEIWFPGEPASGNIVGKLLGTTLSPNSTPLFKQALTGSANDPLGCKYRDGTFEGHRGANASVMDILTENFVFVHVFRATGTPSSTLNAFGKRETGGLLTGFEFNASAADVRFVVDAGTPTRTSTVAWTTPNYDLHYAFCHRYGTNCGLLTDFGTASGSTTGCDGSLTNSGLFAIGSGRTTAAGFVSGPLLLFKGTSAEAMTSARASIMPAWWSSS